MQLEVMRRETKQELLYSLHEASKECEQEFLIHFARK